MWFVVSLLWAAAAFTMTYPEWSHTLEMMATGTRSDWPGVQMLPVPCELARGSPTHVFIEGKPACVQPMSDFRRLYPEYQAFTDTQLIKTTYERVGLTVWPIYRPIWNALGLALLPPLLLAIVGVAFGWVLRGFLSDS